MEGGSEFSIVFSKEPKDAGPNTRGKKFYQIVARVSDDIRHILKKSNDRIYMDLTALKVVDRFFVKRCNKCQHFGHYEKDCENEVYCAYCGQTHRSEECEEVQEGDYKNYDCINCSRAGEVSLGHSSIWHKCPCFIEQQNKVKKSIPYYSKNK